MKDRAVSDNGMRVVVRRSFIEVIEMEDCASEAAGMRRVHSAPAPESRTPSTPSSDVEDLPHQIDDAAQDDLQNVEGKSTVVLRNLPLSYTRDQLLALLDAEGFAGKYDFLYLPIEFTTGANFGYSFVNLTSPEHAVRFFHHFEGFGRWESAERAAVGWSVSQGLPKHIERYRNSPVMHENMLDECKPITLSGGVRVDFPPPTKKVPLLRRLRTRCGSRGRAVPLTGPGAISSGRLKAARSGPEVQLPCPLLPGLSTAPGCGGMRQDGFLATASPLLAGLKYAGEEVFSEASTDVPSPYSSFLSATSCGGMSDVSDASPVVAARGSAPSSSNSLGNPRFESILSEGLLPAPPPPKALKDLQQQPLPAAALSSGSLIEIVGTYPSGEQAIVTSFDPVGGSYHVQLMRNGHLTHRRRTIKFRNARLLPHA